MPFEDGEHEMNAVVYNMEAFLHECVARYLDLTGMTTDHLHFAETPYMGLLEVQLHEDEWFMDDPAGVVQPARVVEDRRWGRTRRGRTGRDA